MINRSLTLLLSFSLLLCLEACVLVGLDYKTPAVQTPDAWTVSFLEDREDGFTDISQWWRGMNDPILNELIDRTHHANPNLRAAASRITEARALRGVARSQLFPSANAGGDYARNRASESLLAPVPTNPSDLYAAGFDAGWEIDVFGGLRRQVESAEASVDASVEAYRDLLVTLLAETALNYVEYRTLEERIRFAGANIEAQEDSVDLTQSRLDAGLVSRIDVTQATTNLESSRSLIPALRSQLALTRNRLASLTGNYPASLDDLLSQGPPIPRPPSRYAAKLPADLIRARPDVRQAERELAAQTARIGVAEADLFPRFSLFGNFALQSVESSDFFDASSRTYSFGPSFQWQIFSAGRIRNNIRVEEARTEQALANYENTILLAVEEVETSMAAIANERVRLATLNRAVASAAETVGLVVDNYTRGLIDFQRVLDSERTKFSTEDEAAVSRGQIARNYITLYKALGGGSEVEVTPLEKPDDSDRPPID